MNKREVGSFSVIRWFKRGFHMPKLRYNSDLGRVEPDEIEPKGHSGKRVTTPIQICDHGIGANTMLLAAMPNYKRYITRVTFNYIGPLEGPVPNDTHTQVDLTDNGVIVATYTLRLPPIFMAPAGTPKPEFGHDRCDGLEFGNGKGIILIADGQLNSITYDANMNYNPFALGCSIEYYEKPIN